MITFTVLREPDIYKNLFDHFRRHQLVTKCRRKCNGVWVDCEDAFTDDWSPEDYRKLRQTLYEIIAQGGFVIGAFNDTELKGFAAVKAGLFGSRKEYIDLPYIHVSEDMRGRGIGKELFQRTKEWARAQGAQKLYISAHSAVETQAFYTAMGCVEAAEYDREHVRSEPCDCQLECSI